ncbi:hypothetical protein M8J76_007914 [Diaphorina citri]|nr:hypothetical protein M8J76_007914 [Diaphorina citri]
MLAQFSQVFGKLFNLLRSLSETTAATPSLSAVTPSATVPGPSANPPIASTNYNVDLIWNQIESAKSIVDLTDISRMIFINRLQYLDSELPGFMQCPKCATYSSRVEDLEAQTTMFIGMIMNVEKKVESDQMKHDAKSDGHLTQPPVDHPTELPVVHPKEPPDYPVIPVQPPVGHPMQSPVTHPQQTLGEYSEQPPDYPKKPPGYPVTWREWKNKKWKERNERRNEERSGKDSKQMNNICNKQTNTQLFHSSASPLLLTDTFLLMTLIPAGQCFLKFVSNFLSGNNSTADDSNNRSRENEHESLELFRNSLTQRSSLFSQDWDKVHFNMLRSTSLQNFSVSHFNFFPTGSHVENVYRTSTPPRSQIEHNYLTSLSPESRFENHFHASPSPEPQEKHCSEKDLIDNHQQTISVMEDSLKLYENDVSYLENNIQALRNKSQESDKLIRELERNVSRLNKLLERKESDLAEANRKVHNYHKYYCWSLVQIANLMKEENSLRDENINLLLLMEECCSDNEYCEEKLKEYQEKLNMIEKEMSELTMDIERRNQSFQEEKAKSADATAKLRAENESLKVQCEVQTSEAAKCSQMMTLYKKRIEQVKHLLETKTYEVNVSILSSSTYKP